MITSSGRWIGRDSLLSVNSLQRLSFDVVYAITDHDHDHEWWRATCGYGAKWTHLCLAHVICSLLCNLITCEYHWNPTECECECSTTSHCAEKLKGIYDKCIYAIFSLIFCEPWSVACSTGGISQRAPLPCAVVTTCRFGRVSLARPLFDWGLRDWGWEGIITEDKTICAVEIEIDLCSKHQLHLRITHSSNTESQSPCEEYRKNIKRKSGSC